MILLAPRGDACACHLPLRAACLCLPLAQQGADLRHILKKEGVHSRWTHTWATSEDPDLRPERARVVALYTGPPTGATTLCAGELDHVIPRTFPPAPGWSPDGHRIKAPLAYSRGQEKVWGHGTLRVCDGQEITLTAPWRNTAGYLRLLDAIDHVHPQGAYT